MLAGLTLKHFALLSAPVDLSIPNCPWSVKFWNGQVRKSAPTMWLVHTDVGLRLVKEALGEQWWCAMAGESGSSTAVGDVSEGSAVEQGGRGRKSKEGDKKDGGKGRGKRRGSNTGSAEEGGKLGGGVVGATRMSAVRTAIRRGSAAVTRSGFARRRRRSQR